MPPANQTTDRVLDCKSISIPELHELSEDDCAAVSVTVSRNVDIRVNYMGAYDGMALLTRQNRVSMFKSPVDALAFYDDLREHGLLDGLLQQDSIDTPEDALEAIQPSPDEETDAREYFEQTGLRDPMNLDFNVIIKRLRSRDQTKPEQTIDSQQPETQVAEQPSK